MACSSVWSRIGLSRYIACRIGRVEAGQQLGGDDQDLQRVIRVAEAVEQFLFGVPVALERRGNACLRALCRRPR